MQPVQLDPITVFGKEWKHGDAESFKFSAAFSRLGTRYGREDPVFSLNYACHRVERDYWTLERMLVCNVLHILIL